jgi:hypothetical protein
MQKTMRKQWENNAQNNGALTLYLEVFPNDWLLAHTARMLLGVVIDETFSETRGAEGI